jgi:photosystem II stability/assembly factor-like uncharacterized protein
MQHLNRHTARIVMVLAIASALLLQHPVAMATQTAPADRWEQITSVPVTSVSAFAVDPSDANILYAAGALNGVGSVMRSDDGGQNWAPIASGSSFANVFQIVAAKTVPATLYVATGKSIMRSTDMVNWTDCTAGTGATNLDDIVVDPSTPSKRPPLAPVSTVYAGLWRSVDSGAHWTKLSAQVIAVNPVTPTTLYAGDQMGVLQSTDRGAHWKRLGTAGLTDLYVARIIVDPAKPTTLYVGTSHPPGDYSVFRSDDTGAHWTDISAGGLSGVLRLLDLAVNGNGTRTLYAATPVGIVRSDDSGKHWIPAFTGLPPAHYWNVATETGAEAVVYAWNHSDNRIFCRANAMTPSLAVTLTLTLNNPQMTVAAADGTQKTIELDAAPMLGTGNRTLVPVRAIAEAFGVTVTWDAATRVASVTGGLSTLKLTVGKATAIRNGLDTPIDANAKVVPVIVSGRMLLPLRFVAESLGADVSYNQTTKTISITYSAF